MSPAILSVFLAGFALRLLSLAISMRNERRLKAGGAVEYGRRNSIVLALLHALFYFAALGEGTLLHVQWGLLASAGLAVYAFSFIALFIVIIELSPVWTVKLIIAPEHPLNRSLLFRRVRHPNYFLNVLPELAGLTLLMQSWIVAAFLFPPYLCALTVRIRQEERAMKVVCPEY